MAARTPQVQLETSTHDCKDESDGEGEEGGIFEPRQRRLSTIGNYAVRIRNSHRYHLMVLLKPPSSQGSRIHLGFRFNQGHHSSSTGTPVDKDWILDEADAPWISGLCLYRFAGHIGLSFRVLSPVFERTGSVRVFSVGGEFIF